MHSTKVPECLFCLSSSTDSNSVFVCLSRWGSDSLYHWVLLLVEIIILFVCLIGDWWYQHFVICFFLNCKTNNSLARLYHNMRLKAMVFVYWKSLDVNHWTTIKTSSDANHHTTVKQSSVRTNCATVRTFCSSIRHTKLAIRTSGENVRMLWSSIRHN